MLISRERKDNNSFIFYLKKDEKYAIQVGASGYLSQSLDFLFKNPDFCRDSVLNFYLDKISCPPTIDLKAFDILFENNSSSLSNLEKQNIKENIYLLLKNNPSFIIEIAGHSCYNESVGYSKKRAENVFKELVLLGINEKRLKTQDFGILRPKIELQYILDQNQLKNRKLKDSENSRVSFRVISIEFQENN